LNLLSYKLNKHIGIFYSKKGLISKNIDELNIDINNLKYNKEIPLLVNRKNKIVSNINLIEKKINDIEDNLKLIESITTYLEIIINILLINPLPLQFLSAGVITTINKKLKDIEGLVLGLKILSSNVMNILKNINLFLENEKKRINKIHEILEDISENIDEYEDSELIKITNNSNIETKNELQEGEINGSTFRGFRFILKFEQGNNKLKKIYIEVLDRSGFIVLRSEKSYTTEPEVLIQKLKNIIIKQNLKA
jgi:hypothetical protein